MYPWNNEKILQDLKIKGQDDVLTFEANGERVEVHIKNNDIEKMVCHYRGKETTINKAERIHVAPGEENTRRDVYHYLRPGGPMPTMRAGITIHRGQGTWSSLPHEFELKTEPGFEEVFFYLLQGGSQRAVQVGKGVWCDNAPVDKCWFVKDRTWGTVPMGYHPVVGEPGVKVSYVWVYLAKKPEWEKVAKNLYVNESYSST